LEDLEEMEVSLDASETVEKSTKLADQMLSDPESLNIPWFVLDNAVGVMIFPGMVKAGFIAGGSFGSGKLFTREGNKW
jgi:lipid-binding SYLF domain-containing protein